MMIKLVGVCGSICLNWWKDQAPNQPLHHVLMMINYDAVFFSQGCIDQCYFKAMMRTRNRIGNTAWAPISVVAFIFLYALCAPSNYTQTGFLFFYPLYSDYTIQCLYTTGTWIWIYMMTWIMHYAANKKFSERGYKLLAGSSLYAYLSHYFFIIVIAVGVIRPYKIDFLPALFIVFVLTNAMIFVSYIILNFMYELAFPPKSAAQKAQEKMEEEEALLKKEIEVEAGKKRD